MILESTCPKAKQTKIINFNLEGLPKTKIRSKYISINFSRQQPFRMGSGEKVLCEPVPNLRNYGARCYRKNLIFAIVFSGVGALLFHHFVVAANEKKVKEFYSTYDADAAFHRMKDRGLFNCVGTKDA